MTPFAIGAQMLFWVWSVFKQWWHSVALALLQFCCVQMRTHSFGWCVHRLCDVDIALACAFVLMFTASLMTVFMTFRRRSTFLFVLYRFIGTF